MNDARVDVSFGMSDRHAFNQRSPSYLGFGWPGLCDPSLNLYRVALEHLAIEWGRVCEWASKRFCVCPEGFRGTGDYTRTIGEAT